MVDAAVKSLQVTQANTSVASGESDSVSLRNYISYLMKCENLGFGLVMPKYLVTSLYIF